MENHAHDHQPGQAVDGTHTGGPGRSFPSSRRDRNSESRTRDLMPGLAPGAPSSGGPMHRDRERCRF